jgi:hypothetical protein
MWGELEKDSLSDSAICLENVEISTFKVSQSDEIRPGGERFAFGIVIVFDSNADDRVEMAGTHLLGGWEVERQRPATEVGDDVCQLKERS